MSVASERMAAEDALLERQVQAFSVTGMEDIAARVRALVNEVAQKQFLHFWAEVYLFGSSGLGAAIEGSDADLYGEHSSFPFSSPPRTRFFSLPPPRPSLLLILIFSSRVPVGVLCTHIVDPFLTTSAPMICSLQHLPLPSSLQPSILSTRSRASGLLRVLTNRGNGSFHHSSQHPLEWS